MRGGKSVTRDVMGGGNLPKCRRSGDESDERDVGGGWGV